MRSSLQDLQRIGVGPRVVDFGRVSASSSNTAYLLVSNPLRSSIHVVLAVVAVPELKGSEVLSQVCACILEASRNLQTQEAGDEALVMRGLSEKCWLLTQLHAEPLQCTPQCERRGNSLLHGMACAACQ